MREGDSVCQALGTLSLYEPKAVDTSISIFKQKIFLSKLKKMLREPTKAKEIQNKLNSLRKYLLSDPSRVFLQISKKIFFIDLS